MSRPPRLPDTTLLALISELRATHPALTGTRLREELTRRHGTPCGVARVYRLLRTSALTMPSIAPPTAALGHLAIAPDSIHSSTAPQSPASPSAPAPATPSTVGTGDLLAQLRQALERAELAEYREESHQTRWAGEIHALREQLRDASNSGQRMRWMEDEVRNKARELASAFLRIADLENQLRTLEER